MMPPRFEHEHDDEHEDDLVADLGVSSVERSAALCLCGESSSPFTVQIWGASNERSALLSLSFAVFA